MHLNKVAIILTINLVFFQSKDSFSKDYFPKDMWKGKDTLYKDLDGKNDFIRVIYLEKINENIVKVSLSSKNFKI